MTPFQGFPPGVNFTPVPDPLFKTFLETDDIAEMKVSLYLIWLLHQKKGYPNYVTLSELLGNGLLTQALTRPDLPGDEVLRQGLEQAVARGTFLKVVVIREGDRKDLYLLNTEASRKAAGQIERGNLDLGRPLPFRRSPPPVQTPDIFHLYEENIGLVTPLLADELKEAERSYPPVWIEDAFGEAVALNKRSWRYISRILERWALEGKSDGKPGRNPQKTASSRK